MTGAEAQYCQMEAELQSYLDNYESTHDYDEYHFDLDAIEHDPYVLISILSAFNEGEFTLDEVQGLLQTLFDRNTSSLRMWRLRCVTGPRPGRGQRLSPIPKPARPARKLTLMKSKSRTTTTSVPLRWKTLTSPICRSTS